MSRRIILLDIHWTRDKDPRIPLGHASLLAALAADGQADVHSLIVAENGPDADPKDIVDRVLAASDGAGARDVDVAIGVYVWAEARVQRVLTQLRARGFAGRIILGGPQISYAQPGVAALYPQADAFVRGYAEQALCALVRRPGRPRVPGVVYQGGFDFGQVASVELEQLPSPWLTGVLAPDPRFIRWETQRGCVYRCSFCQHREAGSRLRNGSLADARVFDEIDWFCRNQVRDIAVLDPIFNARDREHGSARACQILERFADRNFRGRLSLQCRPELVDERFLASCSALDTRLEFGLQSVIPSEWGPIQRGNKLELVEQTLAACRARGIAHEVTLMFGLPGQTPSSFERSIQWCLDREVPVIKAFPLMLLRGTPLERERARWQLEEDASAIPVVVRSTSFDEHDWRHMAALSDALARTEGRHPRDVATLRREFEDTVAMDRWTPCAG